MESTIERLPNRGLFHHYVISIGSVKGEVISIPRYVEEGINYMLVELRRAQIQ
jgi:hypothetical protein